MQKELATFGGGCFWCLEAVFQRMDGVRRAVPGYMGGKVPNPDYEAVCTGETGHAEVVRVEFDPEVVAYRELVDRFWQMHDPTTLNRQGADVGTQYRSVIFCHSDHQKQVAMESMQAAAPAFASPIVTEIVPAQEFYAAEGYHRDYYNKHSDTMYCRLVIEPKLAKLGLK